VLRARDAGVLDVSGALQMSTVVVDAECGAHVNASGALQVLMALIECVLYEGAGKILWQGKARVSLYLRPCLALTYKGDEAALHLSQRRHGPSLVFK
jgi:hypothetical protein